MITDNNTAVTVLNLLKQEPTIQRDIEIIDASIAIFDLLKFWKENLQNSLEEKVKNNVFGKDAVKTCEESWLANQCLLIGSLSR